MKPSTLTTAEEVRAAFARRGVIAMVRQVEVAGTPAVLQVQFRAAWPFPMPDGSLLRVGMAVDPSRLSRQADLEAWVTYALQRAEADLLVNLLPPLVDRARLRGVHRRALASFAREVVAHITEYLHPGSAEVGWITQYAAPYTHADGKGDQ